MITLTDAAGWPGGRSVLALGMFDGVHLGHRALLAQAVRLSGALGAPSVACAFAQHPQSVLRAQPGPPELTPPAQKEELMAALGIDVLYLQPFTRALADMPPDAYVRALVRTFAPLAVVVGFNHRFGARGAGTPALLREMGAQYGFEVQVIDAVSVAGETVSATAIREALARGDLPLANAMLGRPYRICGVVERGKGLGRTLGYPTANVKWPRAQALPGFGVYAARAHTGAGAQRAVLNIGNHPTAPGGKRVTLEVHLMDAGAQLYRDALCVDFVSFIRPEQRFESMDALSAQIARDFEEAARRLAGD